MTGEAVTFHVCPECGFSYRPDSEQRAEGLASRENCTGAPRPGSDRPPLHCEVPFEKVRYVPETLYREAEARAQRFRDYADSADRDQARTVAAHREQLFELRETLAKISERSISQRRTLTGLAGAESADENYLDRAKGDADWIGAVARAALDTLIGENG